jgi:hypothetical protein
LRKRHRMQTSIPLHDAQWEWTPPQDADSDAPRRRPGVLVYSRSRHLANPVNHGFMYWGATTKGSATAVGRDDETLPKWKAIALMMADWHAMVVRDGVDPQVAHREFLKIKEYRQLIAEDIDGAE